jgi:hypothetical protein
MHLTLAAGVCKGWRRLVDVSSPGIRACSAENTAPVARDPGLHRPPGRAIENMKTTLRSRLKFPLRFNLFQSNSNQKN